MKTFPLLIISTSFFLTACNPLQKTNIPQEMSGRYYTIKGSGSALFFKPENENGEIWLHDKKNFFDDQNLYKTLDLSEFYEENDKCQVFSGKATLILNNIEKTGENRSNANLIEVKDKTAPNCEQ